MRKIIKKSESFSSQQNFDLYKVLIEIKHFIKQQTNIFITYTYIFIFIISIDKSYDSIFLYYNMVKKIIIYALVYLQKNIIINMVIKYFLKLITFQIYSFNKKCVIYLSYSTFILICKSILALDLRIFAIKNLKKKLFKHSN